VQLYFEYPIYLVIVAAVIAAAVAFLLYRKDRLFTDLEKWKKRLMTSLRFLFVFLILLMLLNPVFKSTGTIVQKPVVVFVQDNSSSILLNKDSSYYKTGYKGDVDQLIESLQEKYDVRYLQFDEFTGKDSIMDFSGELTDVSSVFPEVISRFAGMNLGAVIIATDGIYNIGSNPAYLGNLSFPVYPLALGDTVTQKDLILKDLMHNHIAFLGNKFPLKVFVAAEKCPEKKAEIIIKRDEKVIYRAEFDMPENSVQKSLDIELPADRTGIQQYSVELKHLVSEISYVNNHSDFVVNIIDNRNKILLLANAPHPDVGAIKSALKDNPDFELTVKYIADLDVNVKDFDLVILHQLPSLQNKATTVLSEIEKNSVPVLYIIGTATSLQAFNSLGTGLEIAGMSNKTDDASPTPNNSFLAFDPGVDMNTFFRGLSPLRVNFGEYRFTGDAKVFLYQSINGVKTSKPLIAFIDQSKAKIGFITGEGLWRWRLDDFKFNSGHEGFNSVVNRIIQYLMVRRIQDKLSIDAKQVFNENEPVILNASFYNEAFELVPNLDINLLLKNEEGKEFKYAFSDFGNAYRLDMGRLPAGKYTYVAKSKFDNRDYTANGQFIVKKVNVEALVTTAGHPVLFQLAEQTGGKVFYPRDMQNIPATLEQNASISNVAYKSEKLHTITDLWIIFVLILLFAAAEWSLRKYWGGY
jgi:hypothetical protein